jgi:hypothetical protein
MKKINWKRKWKWFKLKTSKFLLEAGEGLYEVMKMGWKPY